VGVNYSSRALAGATDDRSLLPVPPQEDTQGPDFSQEDFQCSEVTPASTLGSDFPLEDSQSPGFLVGNTEIPRESPGAAQRRNSPKAEAWGYPAPQKDAHNLDVPRGPYTVSSMEKTGPKYIS
jgi:hypothetical protein